MLDRCYCFWYVKKCGPWCLALFDFLREDHSFSTSGRCFVGFCFLLGLLFTHKKNQQNNIYSLLKLLNVRTVYDWFNNPFPDDCGIPYFNLLIITSNNSPHLYKRARYAPDLLSDSIYVASEKSVSTFTTPYDDPKSLVLTYDDTNLPPRHEERQPCTWNSEKRILL